jgi:hypothetical protein
MPRLGFEPMIPVFELEKTAHALDLAATVMGKLYNSVIRKITPLQICKIFRNIYNCQCI